MYPGVAIKKVHDKKIAPAQHNEKDSPNEVESPPDWLRQAQIAAKQAFDGRFLTNQLTEQKGGAKKPVDDGWFQLDELLVAQEERKATEDEKNGQGDPLHSRNGPGFYPRKGALTDGSGNGHSGSDIDIKHFVGNEKKEYRKEIDKEFH